MQVEIDPDGAMEIASRSRGTPRIANRMLRRVRDFAQVRGSGIITKEIADEALLRLIESLGEPDSDIIIQKYYYNMNSNEIASKHSMSPEAVRMRCSRALKKLKELLTREGYDMKEAWNISASRALISDFNRNCKYFRGFITKKS